MSQTYLDYVEKGNQTYLDYVMKGLCRFCDKIITEEDKWRMIKGGEPHCSEEEG